MTSSEGFQQHFSTISKSVCCGFYMKNNVAFHTSLLLYSNEMIVHQLSVQLPFELPVQITVKLLLELEANLIAKNVNELEFELSRM